MDHRALADSSRTRGHSLTQSGQNQVLIAASSLESFRLLGELLSKAEFSLFLALNAQAAITACAEGWPALVILDVRIDESLEVVGICKAIRSIPLSSRSHPPLLILTARVLPDFETSGVTCIVGEFDGPTLMTTVRRVLDHQRKGPALNKGPDLRDLSFDEERRIVLAGGTRVDLTEMEFDLLLALAKAQGRTVVRESLLTTARGWTPTVAGRSVDVHFSSIRRKLGKFGGLLETVRGKGYRLRHDGGAAQ